MVELLIKINKDEYASYYMSSRIREMQMKEIRYHYTPIRKTKVCYEFPFIADGNEK
jgi:hypothetical protein